MLHENTVKNQEKLTPFENLKLELISMLKSDDLKPETIHVLEKAYGKKLFETDHKLYFDPISLASACAIVEATKLRIKQGLITLDEIQVILKNFEPTIKHFDLDLYEQLKELKEERK